jgi:hypothetical protein
MIEPTSLSLTGASPEKAVDAEKRTNGRRLWQSSGLDQTADLNYDLTFSFGSALCCDPLLILQTSAIREIFPAVTISLSR